MGNIVISEEQLARIVGQIQNQVKENHEQGSYMAKQQLFTIATLAYKMWESMPEGEQLEDWQETKIAQAEQSIVNVVKSYMYDEVTDTIKKGDNMNYDDLVIGN
jgi:hypothetical protein